MASKLPQSASALVLQKSPEGRSPVYHDVVKQERPIPALKTGEILVKIAAVAFNRRELWQRLGQYPGIAFGTPIGADGAGTVIASGDPNDSLLQKRVFLVPMRGWDSDPDAPEAEAGLGIIGGGSRPAIGTFTDYVVVERDQVIVSPDHLDNIHLSAWPLGGLTAWRAAVVNARVSQGQNILITGIGGGVALLAMQICIAKGANVYVSSGNEEKISRAVALGAKGGVNYKSKDWPAQLAATLKKDGGSGKLNAVVDSGGGDIMGQVGKVLKAGGRVVCYGMTANPQISFTMREVLKNQRLIGSTMGSHKDLLDATKFISEHRIVPIVSHILDGLGAVEEGFELLKRGDQFGKIVIKLEGSGKASL